MSLKARLSRLERKMEAVRLWWPIRLYEQQLKYLEMRRQIEAHQAAAERASTKPVPAPPPKPMPTPPPPPPPKEARPPPSPPVLPPAAETVAEVPLVQPFVPIQDGLVRWRIRGPQDDQDDDDDPPEDGDYDIFADSS